MNLYLLQLLKGKAYILITRTTALPARALLLFTFSSNFFVTQESFSAVHTELVTSLARSGRSLVSLECSSHKAIPILATASHREWKGKEPGLGVLPRMGVWWTESSPTSFCSECLGLSTLFCPFMVTRMFISSPEK